MIHLVLIICITLWSFPASAAIYYVDDTLGSDSNSGTAASPYRTIKRGTQSPTAPGDTIIVRAGTYTASDIGRTDIAVFIDASQSSVAGSPGNPITLISETPGGAEIKIPSANAGTHGINITQPYWTIEGFSITSSGVTQVAGTNDATAAILVATSNVTIRRNYIHDVSRELCSDSAFSHQGVSLLSGASNITIENNIFANIGRRLNGESGCSTSRYQHDHGIYSKGASSVTIRRNIFYGVDRGFVLQLFTSGATHNNISFVHNTIDGGSPDTRLSGTMVFCNTLSNITVENNIVRNQAHGYLISWCSGTTASNMVVKNNVSNTHDETGVQDLMNPSGMPGAGITASGNLFDKTLGLVSTTSGSEDFSLTSSSQAIDAGLALGDSYCDSAPDAGAYEASCGALSATISGTTMEVSFQQAFGLQVQDALGLSFTCTVGCTGATIASATLKAGSSSVISININGLAGNVCDAGATFTVSYDATVGSISDEIKIGGSSNQKVFTFSSLAVTNDCASTPPVNPTGEFGYYPLNGNIQDASGNAHDGTQSGGTFVTARYGQGFSTSNGTTDYATIPYGNNVNIGAQSFTLAMAINVPLSDVGLTRNYMGTAEGDGTQRLYILSRAGTWGVVVQNDGASWAASDLAVEPGWNMIVLRVDATTNTATLCKNGSTGTAGYAVNTYTDHTLPSHINIGNPPGFSTSSAPSAIYDEVRVWTSLKSCADIWAAWEPPATHAGTHNQVAHRFQYVYTDGSGNPVNLGTAINQDQVVTRSGGVAVEFQIDCANITDCTSASYRLWYSFDGVNFAQAAPDIPAAEGLSMWGESADHNLNNMTVTCPLTGALPCTDGGTIMTARATTPINLTKNTSYVVRFIVKTAWATWTDFYLQLRHQDGTVLSSYTPTNGAHMIMHDTDASGP